MKLSTFLKETRAESKHISWPSKKSVTIFTLSVILISFAVGYYLGFFDFVFTSLLNTIL